MNAKATLNSNVGRQAAPQLRKSSDFDRLLTPANATLPARFLQLFEQARRTTEAFVPDRYYAGSLVAVLRGLCAAIETSESRNG
jgi:hypothetical protein